jgi:AcrR family transcriptional regulator
MSGARRYDMTLRGEQAAQTRQKVIASARKVLVQRGALGFSLEHVAKAAGLTRVTLYKHFETKRGLFEALLDDLGARGHAERLGEVAKLSEPRAALRALVVETCRFWAFDAPLFRRLIALGGVDPEMGASIEARNARRRGPVEQVVARLSAAQALRLGWTDQAAVEALNMLTQFAAVDALASPEETLLRLCEAFVTPER